MTRPKIKVEKSFLDKSMEVLTFLLIAVSALLIGIYYQQLPEKSPIPFNWPSKDKNGFGTKDLLWASPIICGIIGLALYKLNQYPWIFNYPSEIDQENAAYNYKMATRLVRIIALVIGFMCLSMTLSAILNGLGNTTKFDTYFDPIFLILLIGLPIFYAIKIFRNSKSRQKIQ